MILFEWDEAKNKSNKKKHKVEFEEAESVFFDEDALLIFDSKHSDFEDRYILLGTSVLGNILVVVHCYRNKEEIIRIISARKATKNEEMQYLKG